MGQQVYAIVLLCGAAAMAPPAQTVTTLATFNASTGGQSPIAALIQGTDGNLHGSTYSGPTFSGAIFRVTPSGTLTSQSSSSRPAAR